MFKGTNIPAIPMIAIRRQYAYANKLPFDGRWETITRLFQHYSNKVQLLN